MGILLYMITLFSFWFVWKQYIYFSLNSVALAIYSVLSACWWPDPRLPQSSEGFEWSLWLRKQKYAHAPCFLKAWNGFCYQGNSSAELSQTSVVRLFVLQQTAEVWARGGYNNIVNTCCAFLTQRRLCHIIRSQTTFFLFLLWFQILRWRQIFPEEQHDSVPDRLWGGFDERRLCTPGSLIWCRTVKNTKHYVLLSFLLNMYIRNDTGTYWIA